MTITDESSLGQKIFPAGIDQNRTCPRLGQYPRLSKLFHSVVAGNPIFSSLFAASCDEGSVFLVIAWKIWAALPRIHLNRA
jgi:hypothetical protein